jgi:ABC-type glutathione transport system ATPase component
MLLEKDMFVSDLGKELWERYFGFLDKKPAPKQEVDDVEDPYERLFPDPKKKEKRTEQQQPKEAAKGKEDEESSKPSLLEEIGSQFRKEQTEQTIHRPREQKTIDIKVDEKEERLTTHSMNLHNVVKYFKNKGVVGEEGLAVAITLALINKASFGVEGYSGSGKTFITDKLIELVEDKVYTIGLSSKLAIFSDLMRMNTKQIIYIPELQKAMQDRNSAIIEACYK